MGRRRIKGIKLGDQNVRGGGEGSPRERMRRRRGTEVLIGGRRTGIGGDVGPKGLGFEEGVVREKRSVVNGNELNEDLGGGSG